MSKSQNINDLKYLAHNLDSKFQLPFGIKVGLDGVIGLIPGIGDFITNSISIYIVLRAALIGCGPSLILKMCLNILIENIIDVLPVVGNLFDFFWKSNLKNIHIIEEYLESPSKALLKSRLLAISLVLFLATLLGLFVYSSVWLLIWSWGFIQNLLQSGF